MKTFTSISLLMLPLTWGACSVSQPDVEQQAWRQCDSLLAALQTVDIPSTPYVITSYGAVAVTDGREPQLCTEAIQRAIKEAHAAGGGTVVVPDSTYLTGPITLLSNVNLHLSDGAVLRFSTDQSLYFPAVETRWEGVDCYNAHPLLYALDQHDIALTGKGTLDAQGSRDNWWAMCGATHFGWHEGIYSQSGVTLAQKAAGDTPRQKLIDWCTNRTPLKNRVMTPQDGMRPQFVNFNRCKRVLIEDVTLLNSPFWVLHPLFCEDVTVRGVTVNNEGPNGDGCDPECCNRVLIENCVFHTGDDCIAIKSGRNQDGRDLGEPSQNIVVRGCKMEDGHGGVVIGSEIAGGYRNLWVEDCDMDSPNLDRVIRIKTSPARGGVIENVWVRNVRVGRCKEAVLRINLNYDPKEKADRSFNPTVRGVHLTHVTCHESRYAMVLNGLNDGCYIEDVTIKDCDWTGVKGGPKGNLVDSLIWTEGLYRDIHFDSLTVNGKLLPSLANTGI